MDMSDVCVRVCVCGLKKKKEFISLDIFTYLLHPVIYKN